MKKMPFLMLIILIAANCMTCNRTMNPLEPQNKLVRSAIRLSPDTLPILKETIEFTASEKPEFWEVGWDDSEKYHVVKFSYSWRNTDNDFTNVDLIVAETDELACRYLDDRRAYSSLPLQFQEAKDLPAVAGDISYGNGNNFIRNNIIVEIRAEGEFAAKTTEIAKQIDALLLKSLTAKSAEQFKPGIKKFEIVRNPVKRRSVTMLIIHVKDPMNGTLFYKWRFTPGAESRGGIEIDESGNYLYYAGTYESVEKLTLIVINSFGFCSFSTIDIQVEP